MVQNKTKNLAKMSTPFLASHIAGEKVSKEDTSTRIIAKIIFIIAYVLLI